MVSVFRYGGEKLRRRENILFKSYQTSIFVPAACMTFHIISPSSKLLSMHVELFMDLLFMLKTPVTEESI